jgi:hypothetical protein
MDVGTESAPELLPHGSVALQLLQLISELDVPEPQLAEVCTSEERRLQQEMALGDVSIDALLTQPRATASACVTMLSETGDTLFDVGALYRAAMARYEHYTSRTGGTAAGVVPSGGAAAGGAIGTGAAGAALTELPAAAVRGALTYAQRYNTHVLLRGAHTAVAQAWAQAVEVAFTRQYERLGAALRSSGGGVGISPAEALHELLSASLMATRRVLARGDSGLALTLVGVARMLLSKLTEQVVVNVSLGQPSDPLALIRTPARCHELLRCTLELLQRSRRTQPVRVQLYGALLQYLQYCRGSKLSAAAPVVLEAVLEGWGLGGVAPHHTAPPPARAAGALMLSPAGQQHTGATHTGNAAAARLDATQDAVERGNAALLCEQGPCLVELLARDALDPASPQLHQALALHLLCALLGAPGGDEAQAGAIASALYASNVPQALLQLMTTLPHMVLVQPSGKRARRSVYVIEAQLALLLRLAEAGPPRQRQLSAQRLHALHALQYATGCGALDLEPEDAGALRGEASTCLLACCCVARLLASPDSCLLAAC